MPQALWDASALAKRYALETGSAAADALFDSLSLSQMITTFLSYAETFSLLLRKHNRGDISLSAFSFAVSALQAETINSQRFALLSISDSDIIRGVEFVRRYNINSSDAAILAAFLRYSSSQPSGAVPCILIASDKRFLRAAEAEGLATLDPEQVSAADVPARLAAL